MRFLVVSTQYLPNVGGVERYTHGLAGELARIGHEVCILTSAMPEAPQWEQERCGVSVARLPAWRALEGRLPLPRKNAEYRRMMQKIWATKPEFALIHTRFYPLSLWVARQCKKRGIPALVIDHSTQFLSLGNRAVDAIVHVYERAAMWYMQRQCAEFYGVSLACNEWLRRLGAEPRGVLYNAVDVEALCALAQNGQRNYRAEFGLPQNAPLVVFSARFVREKGVYILLDAFEILRQNMPQAALVMAGDGPEHADAVARGEENVFFAGSLPYEQNIALIAQADVFCLPTYYPEGFPTTVLEAAAVGTCVVVSDAGGSAELICDGESGILLGDLQPQTVADALRRALADKEWRMAAQQEALARVRRQFTWNAVAENIIEIAAKEHSE